MRLLRRWALVARETVRLSRAQQVSLLALLAALHVAVVVQWTASARGGALPPVRPPYHRVDLNCAGVDELCLLPGVGEKRAFDLIALRGQPGGITSWKQVESVHGIGAETIRELIPFCAELAP